MALQLSGASSRQERQCSVKRAGSVREWLEELRETSLDSRTAGVPESRGGAAGGRQGHEIGDMSDPGRREVCSRLSRQKCRLPVHNDETRTAG